MMGIIARIEPYYLTLYLDDDDSGPRGPTSGDLLATPFGGQDLSVEIHGDGDVIVNPVLNEVNP
jgi:hypothetical protein